VIDAFASMDWQERRLSKWHSRFLLWVSLEGVTARKTSANLMEESVLSKAGRIIGEIAALLFPVQ